MEERSRAEVIAGALRKAIIEQALEPGAKLPEDMIGETFQVSRTIARRALELLAAEELVEIRPNRGASVAKPTLAEGRDLFGVRIDLERVVVRRLTGALTTEQVRQLTTMVDREHEAHHRGLPDYIRLAAEFHCVLGEMTRSAVLSRMLAQLVWRSALVLRLYGKPRWDSCNIQEHLDLIDALAGQDADRADELMLRHLNSVLLRALDGPDRLRDGEPGEVLLRYASSA
jgi:DNA-binding GntR family transcriptional regulator